MILEITYKDRRGALTWELLEQVPNLSQTSLLGPVWEHDCVRLLKDSIGKMFWRAMDSCMWVLFVWLAAFVEIFWCWDQLKASVCGIKTHNNEACDNSLEGRTRFMLDFCRGAALIHWISYQTCPWGTERERSHRLKHHGDDVAHGIRVIAQFWFIIVALFEYGNVSVYPGPVRVSDPLYVDSSIPATSCNRQDLMLIHL